MTAGRKAKPKTDTPIQREIAAWVKKGYTLKEIAKVAKMSYVGLWNISSGKVTPQPGTRGKLMNALRKFEVDTPLPRVVNGEKSTPLSEWNPDTF